MRSVVAAQVVGRAGDNSLARSPRGIGSTLGTRGPRYIQQLNPATHARTKDRAQQLDIAHDIGMRGKEIRQVDHAVELVGLLQVLEELIPRGMRRRLIAARFRGSDDLNVVPGERLGTKVIVNICGVANNQHFHGALLPLIPHLS